MNKIQQEYIRLTSHCEYLILVNGEEIGVDAYELTYEQICILAKIDSKKNPRVTYSGSGTGRHEIIAGESCSIVDGTRIKCREF